MPRSNAVCLTALMRLAAWPAGRFISLTWSSVRWATALGEIISLFCRASIVDCVRPFDVTQLAWKGLLDLLK